MLVEKKTNEFSPIFDKKDNPYDKKCQSGLLLATILVSCALVWHNFIKTIPERP